MSRIAKITEGAARWCAYYRANPHRFAKDYLHLNLHLFQKILIIMMNWSSTTAFIGSRGIGKSFLSAVFCVIRCILYPGTKICIASGTRGQSINVLEKIMLELKPLSPELAAEIDEKQTRINGTNAQIVFKNSSYIKVVTASDSARGNRANLLLLDEFRMIAKDVIDTILRKFLTQKTYVLAWYGKTDIAETLSKTIAASIIAVVVGYLAKSVIENISKHTDTFGKNNSVSVEEVIKQAQEQADSFTVPYVNTNRDC